MGIGDDLQSGITGALGDITEFASSNKAVVAGAGLGAVALGAGAIAIARSKKRKTKSKRGRSRDRKFISKQKHEVRRKRKKPAKIYKKKGKYYSRSPLRKAGKKTTKKRVGKVYYTKNGQPYKIMASGKARFIKGKRRKTR